MSTRVIASANGVEATRLAYDLIQQGRDPLDAVVAGVTLVEDDPNDMTVGYGGLPNEDGIVELDAAVMHGPTHRAGAVAGLRNVRHAAQVARLVLQQTKHVLLIGEGANRFAQAQGFPHEDLLTEKARQIWLYWTQTNSPRQDWVPPPFQSLPEAVREFFHLVEEEGRAATSGYQRSEAVERPTGTVHCSAINATGDLSCCTSTSGLAFKLPGRVGDSPIIGAGLYVDNAIGACGSTGRGEENLRHCSSRTAVELMRQGKTAAEAGLEVLTRIVETAKEPWLLGPDGRPNFGLKLYLLGKNGDYAGVSIWGPTTFAVTDEKGTRLDPCEYLFKK
ncbi:N(4)-(beta-N-acetylglucosaminyl)-L-asparaginase [Planctomicrobium piriforme]|uniref:N4-(Beta-N-acetylglucosaminyl)-L-asparaginase n=1 Tax=Planctomicrobium piriforme TaxID=1576369 RepID=A0A1I3M3I5_9PLAN|nr:N(4)-(beta-N-acetylglucosaminyl)-L-asparaginase [Planctomicrobium piriforme]SFI91523.1 N4-(beta-N-acetylglucosaminyl)-L-asparaginase [Planctomicrobium piriforme]